MDERLLSHFSKFGNLSLEEIAAVDATMQLQNYKKGTILLKPTETSSKVFFVLEGIVRQFYLVDGVEKTCEFYTNEQWVLNLNSSTQNTPSTSYLECSIDSKLLVGNNEMAENLYKQYPNLETISRKLMEKVFRELLEKLEDFNLNTPTKRYLALLKIRPVLIQQIPQYQIASFVGVTAESLSRIRKRISQKG